MQTFLEALEQEELQLTRIIQIIQKKLKRRPEGGIKVVQRGKYNHYYRILPSQKEKYPKGEYLKKKDRELASQLVQKEYEEDILKKAEQQLKMLQRFRERYNPTELNDVYSSLKPARKQLVAPVVFDKDWHAGRWIEQTYRQKEPPKEGEGSYTLRNEHVRSKSEKIIADKYFTEGIPYRYECELTLKDGTILHPDFTVLNRRTGKIYYHEHLGKMGDNQYAADTIVRINQYIYNGIFPGEGLIITAECKDMPFDNRVLDNLIEKYFI